MRLDDLLGAFRERSADLDRGLLERLVAGKPVESASRDASKPLIGATLQPFPLVRARSAGFRLLLASWPSCAMARQQSAGGP